jgi:PAS domain S-box-containing protein
MEGRGPTAARPSFSTVLEGPAAQYVSALTLVLVATALRLPFEGWLLGRSPYGLYYPVLVAIAWFCGMGPTAFAAGLAAVCAWYFSVTPRFGFGMGDPGDLASLGVYALTAGSLIVFARVVGAARRALLDSFAARSRLAAIVDSSDDAIIAKDLNGYIQSWNAGAERVFGYRADETLGRSITMLIPEERRSEEDEILATMRRGGRIDHFETVRLHKDGRSLEVSLTVSPIRDAHGVIIGASKIARDVTDRRRAERALARQREWFRVTLVSIGDAVIATDVAGRVTFMNPVAERLTGWRSAEAEGRECGEVFQIVAETTREPLRSPVERVLREGLVVGLANHTVLIARNGSEYPIEDSAAPIRLADGEVAGVVLVFHDVSERRRVERERQTAARERERLLDSERAARTEAERANRLKDDFVATVSHELRTPLNAILGWAQLLMLQRPDPPTLAHGLSVIERNTRLQAELISDLLDVSRIVSGKLRLELRLVDLPTAVEQALDTVRPTAAEKRVTLVADIEPGIGPIAGDVTRLKQVVWNLLSNAVKFTPSEGRVRVRVARDGGAALIEVTDTGVGIRSDFLPHLFDRFRQGDPSTTRRFGGLGLGLTIVKQLVEMHGGTVEAHSEGEQKGSRFSVRLPLHAQLTAAGEATVAPIGSATERLDGLRVLVVEDEPDARELVERVLSESGCRVTAVESAESALEKIAEDPPQLLISDIGLPEQDGYTLMERVRRLEQGDIRTLPGIALTAFARGEDRARALRAGYQAHIAKPVDPSDLLATVASFAQIAMGARGRSA